MGIMNMIFSGKGQLPVVRRAAEFAEKRHKLISNNIANMDTPGYRAKDLDTRGFSRALRTAIDERDKHHPRRFEFKGGRNIDVGPDGKANYRTIVPRDSAALRHDGNNVSVEHEMTKMVKNSFFYKFCTQRMRSSYRKIKSAGAGRG